MTQQWDMSWELHIINSHGTFLTIRTYSYYCFWVLQKHWTFVAYYLIIIENAYYNTIYMLFFVTCSSTTLGRVSQVWG